MSVELEPWNLGGRYSGGIPSTIVWDYINFSTAKVKGGIQNVCAKKYSCSHRFFDLLGQSVEGSSGYCGTKQVENLSSSCH
jgi:hypothetical protein